MYSECDGQLLAISEFNRAHDVIHRGVNQNLLARTEIGFGYQICYGHLRSHPRYRQYVASSDQERMESLVALRAETPCGVSGGGLA